MVAALEQEPSALATYRLNFPEHPTRQVDLERVGAWELTAPAAELWWLSPPCQPYSERGLQRDLDDGRAGSFLQILAILARLPGELLPRHLALENVAGFQESRAHGRLTDVLAGRGYNLRERLLCPTQLGVPSRRPRFYLAASLLPLAPEECIDPFPLRPLARYLDPALAENAPHELLLSPEIVASYGDALPILEPAAPAACTTCFTSGYGRSLVNAGSYLRCGSRIRRFTPEEIIRLLHFPESFCFPDGMTLRRRWGLAGNSLSIVAVREILRAFPELAKMQLT